MSFSASDEGSISDTIAMGFLGELGGSLKRGSNGRRFGWCGEGSIPAQRHSGGIQQGAQRPFGKVGVVVQRTPCIEVLSLQTLPNPMPWRTLGNRHYRTLLNRAARWLAR